MSLGRGRRWAGARLPDSSRLGVALVVILILACVRAQTSYGLGPENDGTTKNVQVGSEVRLILPAEFEWTIEASDTKALSLKRVLDGTVGGSAIRIWSMDVTAAGDFILVANGTPVCQKASPPCAPATMHYRFTIHAT